ncbi:MAG: APC family permease [Armatimonadota bacterium]|nr:APC family permease [Armatimonadota bacterium]
MAIDEASPQTGRARLLRELTLLALVATAVCNVIGGGINVLTVEIQEKIPGIGSLVPLAFVLGAIPALFAALSYGVLASAMPRAGGDYTYISRALHPFLGFIATFSKWFGLAAACGVIAYMDVTLLKAAALYAGMQGAATWLEGSAATVWLPLGMIWLFWLVNLVGIRKYGWTVIVLMGLMLAGGLVVIVYGFVTPASESARAILQSGHWTPLDAAPEAGGLPKLLTAISVLFFAYIGFASISQAGGEARDPSRLLPRAFLLATVIIAGYYMLFAAGVYNAIPWELVARIAPAEGVDLSVPEIMGVIMPQWLAVFVALMAALALANDIPPILLAVSRLFFAWAEDGIFPGGLAAVNERFQTPHWALTTSAMVASLIAVGCYLHGFFQGIDIVVIALCFTYILIALSVITFPRHNPDLYANVAFLRNRTAQILVAVLCIATVGALLYTQIVADLNTMVENLHLAATGETSLPLAILGSNVILWVVVMAIGAVIFQYMWSSRLRAGEDPSEVFMTLPAESEDYQAAEPTI